MKTRIFLADDHQMFRESLRHWLQSQTDLEVVGQTGDGLQIMPMVRDCAPDVVCMDINMPGMSGIEVTRHLRLTQPQVKVVGLSAYSDRHYVQDMFNAGARAFVTKIESSEELLRAIRAVQLGRTYLCPDVAGALAGDLFNQKRLDRPTAAIGPRERQVMKLVAEGYTSSQIAQALHIAASTVEVHRRNIMRKLNLHGVAELTRYVVNNERMG